MRHHYEMMIAVALCALSLSVQANVVYEPLEVISGFNRDCIAEATNKLSTTDSPIYNGKQSSCFATKSVIEAINTGNSQIKNETDLAITIESGWPNDYRDTIKCILDAKDDPLYKDVFFLLAPYDEKNVLTLRPDNNIGGEGTLKFKKVGCYNKMFFLTASLKQSTPSGARKVSAIVYYTDGSTTKDTFNLAEGFGGQDGHKVCMTNIYEGSNPGYFDKNTSNYTPPKGKGCASVFDIDLDETKLVDRVDFKNEVSNSAAIIFAVTGRTADMKVPDEEESVTSAITKNSFSISWAGVPEAETYRVDVATDEDFQHMVGDYDNLEVSKNDTIVYGLEEDTDYYWRVRSVNAQGGQSASSAVRRVKTAGDNPPTTSEADTDIEEQLAPYVGYRTTLAEIDIHRTLYRDGAFNTLCLPFSLSESYIDTCDYFADCQIYEYLSAEQINSQLDLEIQPVRSMEAGVPYLIKWPANPQETIPSPLRFYNVNITTNEGRAIGDEGGIRFIGHIGMKHIPGENQYNLFLGANNTLYWPDNTDHSMKGFRAYFSLPQALSGAPVRRGTPAFLVERANVPTGMEQTLDAHKAKKMIMDGRLVIVRDGRYYTILGGLLQ